MTSKNGGFCGETQVPYFTSKEEVEDFMSPQEIKQEDLPMNEDFDGKIDSRLSEVRADFEKLEQEKTQLNERRTGLVNQVSTIDRRINEINISQIRLDSGYNELLGLLPEDKRAKYIQAVQPPEAKPKPKETTVKKRKDN